MVIAMTRTIIEFISATAVTTGLTDRTDYDPNWYPEGVKISNDQLSAFPLHFTTSRESETTPSSLNQIRRESLPPQSGRHSWGADFLQEL